MSDAEQAALTAARSFCSELFACVDDNLDGYQVTVLTHPGPSVQWIVGLDPAAIASAVREADARGNGRDGGTGTAVYLSMAPRRPDVAHQHPDGRTARGGSSDVGALLGVWADLDYAGAAHTSGKQLPPDAAAVLRILDACGLPPTIVWSSGHGLQAFWGLNEPWCFADDPEPETSRQAAERLVRHWQLTLAMHAHRLGRWQLDATHDLARVLRPAGTTNRKIAGDWRKVEVLADRSSGVRYEIADLEEHLAEREYLDRFASMSTIPADSPVNKVDLRAVWDMVTSRSYRERNYTPEWLERLRADEVIDDDDRLIEVFENGHESGDPSTTDASLARHVADLGLHARDAVEIIMCRRLRAGDKVDKIDPNRRTSYIVTTVGKIFATAQDARERSNALKKEGQNATPPLTTAPRPRPGGGPLPRPADQDATIAAASPTRGLRGLGAATARELDDDIAAVRPDPPPQAPEPDPEFDAAFPAAPSSPDPGLAEPAVAPSAGTADPDQDPGEIPDPTDPAAAGADAAPGARDETDDDGVPLPPEPDEPDEPERATAGTADGPEPPSAAGPYIGDADDGADAAGAEREPETHHDAPTEDRPAAGRARSAWGTRTAHQHNQLDALSETLLGDDRARLARIWRCQTRGRGAKAERRLVMRFHRDTRWPVHPPIGYVPGEPYATGWWPAATFNKLTGWQRVLEQECLLNTAFVKDKDFLHRFASVLVTLWEPDDSGGSLENVTRDAMLSYLLDYPPLTDWADAAAQGMPLIIQSEPPWRLDSEFVVLVRWAEFGQHVRTRFAINVGPAVLAEMAELSGARTMRTQSQDGRWRMVRREYLSDDEWRAVLLNAQHAAQQREDRHGMHIAGSSPYAGADHPDHARRREAQ